MDLCLTCSSMLMDCSSRQDALAIVVCGPGRVDSKAAAVGVGPCRDFLFLKCQDSGPRANAAGLANDKSSTELDEGIGKSILSP